MFRATPEDGPRLQADSTIAPDAADARARRRLALLFLGSIVAMVVVMLVRGEIVRMSRPKSLDGYTIGAVICAPPLLLLAWIVVVRTFRFCQEALRGDDIEAKCEAITKGLRSADSRFQGLSPLATTIVPSVRP